MEMRDIKGYEGKYAVTTDGRVYSYFIKGFITDYDPGGGYLVVNLSKNSKKRNHRINRLVAEAFIPLPDWYTPGMKLDVGHKDDNRTNNNVDNLVWQTRKQNLDTDHWREANKKKIRLPVKCVETGEIFPSIAAAGRAVGIHKYGINCVLLGR